MTAAVAWFVARATAVRPRVSRLHVTPPSAAALTISGLTRDIALTPDGSLLIYIGATGTTLFSRPLDQLEATPLVRGAALRDPFVSPDGQWVGFFDGTTTLKKVAITGGPAVLVAQLDGSERGATWGADGSIIFATSDSMIGLQRVSADGGTLAVLTRPDRARGEAGYGWPELLPGDQAVLYTVTATTGGLDTASIAVLDQRTSRSTILLRGGSNAHYVASGHLMYAAAGTLRAKTRRERCSPHAVWSRRNFSSTDHTGTFGQKPLSPQRSGRQGCRPSGGTALRREASLTAVRAKDRLA
jgi:serine/threonine-protein kinase